MKKVMLMGIALFCFFIFPTTNAKEFFTGEVVQIINEGQEEVFGTSKIFQELKVKANSGSYKDEIISIEKGDYAILTEDQKFKKGDTVVLSDRQDGFQILDRYRLDALWWILGFFVLFVVFLGRKPGIRSLISLGLSLSIIIYFIVPQILAGENPLWISLVGGTGISVLSLYLSHGVETRTTLALISMITTFVIAILISSLFVSWAHLFGVASEEVVYLQIGLGDIDLRGLLLGGILIGILGILDDITISQCATVEEIYKANPTTTFQKLYSQGVSVGRDHLASVINTLALAYVGVSLPLFLLFTLQTEQPLWMIINSEFVAEEIVRTLAGCCALVLAMPISTFLSAYIYTKKKQSRRY